MPSKALSPIKPSTITWDWFLEIFRAKYEPLVERDPLAYEYMLLKKATKLVAEITKMFTKTA